MEQIFIRDQYGTRRYAYIISEYLCAVSFREGYKIYKLKQGKPFIGTIFLKLDDCLAAIKVFDEIYGEYFPIWDNPEWVDADVPAMFQWTVRNGADLYKIVKDMQTNGDLMCKSLQELA